MFVESDINPQLMSVAELWSQTSPCFKDVMAMFLGTFKEDPEDDLSLYERKSLVMLQNYSTLVEVDMQHVKVFSYQGNRRGELYEFLKRNYLQLHRNGCLKELVVMLCRRALSNSNYTSDFTDECLELLKSKNNTFDIALVDWSAPLNIRQLTTSTSGQVTTIKGTVTRLGDTKPELRLAMFDCDVCGVRQPPVIQDFKFTEPTLCVTQGCNNRRTWTLLPEKCIFDDWQRLRLQENADEIPAGCLPCSIYIVARGCVTDRCKPGDRIFVSGTIVVVPDVVSMMAVGEVPKMVSQEHNKSVKRDIDPYKGVSGVTDMGVRELDVKMVVLAGSIQVLNMRETHINTTEDDPLANRGFDSKLFRELTAIKQNTYRSIAGNNKCIDILARQLAPSVYGCVNVKKGILMMLVGGVEKKGEQDGMKLRGDLNVCLVGDPGTGKSMILKCIQEMVPRSVFASGKSSSAAGLTASVLRDPESNGNPVIEAGALMLADKGYCMIDEFDKMDKKDMSAIHEAMEQQTISISKAGVQATLNARASVLAACNPVYGRYDFARSFRHNVKLSDPILSRFDLLFVLTDDPDLDECMADHVIKSHVNAQAGLSNLAADTSGLALSKECLWEYIEIARTLKPKITEAALKKLCTSYVLLRQQDAMPGLKRHSNITVRQLESLVRLSEATAKLHFEDEVTEKHVEIAFETFQSSLAKINKGSIDLNEDEEQGTNENGEKVEHQKLSLGMEEYDKYAGAIIDKMMQMVVAKHEKGENVGVQMTLEDLIDWLVESQLLPAQRAHNMASYVEENEEEIPKLYTLAARIINQMTVNDGTLEALYYTDDDGEAVTLISLSPNVHGGCNFLTTGGVPRTSIPKVVESQEEELENFGISEDQFNMFLDELD